MFKGWKERVLSKLTKDNDSRQSEAKRKRDLLHKLANEVRKKTGRKRIKKKLVKQMVNDAYKQVGQYPSSFLNDKHFKLTINRPDSSQE